MIGYVQRSERRAYEHASLPDTLYKTATSRYKRDEKCPAKRRTAVHREREVG